MNSLPVAVVGAGPVGLAAAAHLARRGIKYLVLEEGDRVGASVLEWGHVRLFSPWRHLVDPVAGSLLDETGWTPPGPELLPTGRELVERMLEPLARHPGIAPSLHTGHRVEAITRSGYDRMRTQGREQAPFELVVRLPEGERRLQARAVIDASGTWRTPRPAGAGGLPARGEQLHAARVRVGMPDVGGAERERYRGRTTAVVGGGHSAFHVLLELDRLRREDPSARVLWILRSPLRSERFGGGGADGLPARGILGRRLHRAVQEGRIEVFDRFAVGAIDAVGPEDASTLVLRALDGREAGPVGEIVVATGFRPDPGLTGELRLGLDPAMECPAALGPLIDPELHSCGTVPPHGHRELRHPEPGFWTVGMKSYGRAPTFLLLTGYEQVRSVVAAIDGDHDSADRVELVLPETGVCLTGVGAGSGCC